MIGRYIKVFHKTILSVRIKNEKLFEEKKVVDKYKDISIYTYYIN